MPGFYADGEYDIAGFIVGVVERRASSTVAGIRPGDALIGLAIGGPAHATDTRWRARSASSVAGWTPDTFVPELGATVGDALLAPHRSYLSLVRPLLEQRSRERSWPTSPAGASPRICPEYLPAGCAAADRSECAWRVPALFRVLEQRGGIAGDEMFRAFNMGIGSIVACASEDCRSRDRALVRPPASLLRRGSGLSSLATAPSPTPGSR